MGRPTGRSRHDAGPGGSSVPHTRKVRRQPGIAFRRCRDLDRRLLGSREPAIVRLEVAVLTVASRRPRPDDAPALVLDACRQRRTTPQRLLDELEHLRRLPRRDLLVRVLRDARDGVESFLELTYLRKVERAHGLPAGSRQVRVTGDGGAIYRDIEYQDHGLIVELDGRTGHEDTRSRWRDMSRDNAAVTEAKQTLRFGYQLVADPCAAAAQVATVLHALGWPDSPNPLQPHLLARTRTESGERSPPHTSTEQPDSPVKVIRGSGIPPAFSTLAMAREV